MKNILENNRKFSVNLDSDSKSILGNQSTSDSVFNISDSINSVSTDISEKKYKRIGTTND